MSSKSPIRLKKSPSIRVRKMGMVALRQKTRFSITGILSKTIIISMIINICQELSNTDFYAILKKKVKRTVDSGVMKHEVRKDTN